MLWEIFNMLNLLKLLAAIFLSISFIFVLVFLWDESSEQHFNKTSPYWIRYQFTEYQICNYVITSAALEKLLVNYAGKYATGDEIYLVCLSWPLESRLYAAYTVFRPLGWAWVKMDSIFWIMAPYIVRLIRMLQS